MQAAATSMAGASRGRGLSTATEATCQWDPCWQPPVGRAGRLSEALARPAASGFLPPQAPAHCTRPGHYTEGPQAARRHGPPTGTCAQSTHKAALTSG